MLPPSSVTTIASVLLMQASSSNEAPLTAIQLIRSNSVTSNKSLNDDLEEASSASEKSLPSAIPSQASRRLSVRDFFGTKDGAQHDWDIVLATGAREDTDIAKQPLDVVVMGHEDGYVSIARVANSAITFGVFVER